MDVLAHELAGSDQGGFNDPYIRLSLSPEVDGRKRQTKIHRNDPNPIFDEIFKFPVSQEEIKEKSLILQVSLDPIYFSDIEFCVGDPHSEFMTYNS